MCRLRKIPQKILSKIPVPKLFASDPVWAEFLQAKLPIFWIIGPSHSGKTTLAHFLSESSNFRLIRIKFLSCSLINRRHCVSKNYATMLKMEMKNSFKYCQGYIIDDFPTTIKQCKQSEKKNCRPTVIIYISINLDATLARALAQHPTVDLNAIRIEYVKQFKFAEKVCRRYEKLIRVVKVFSQYPIQDTHAKVLEILENEYGYRFKHVVKAP